MGIAPQILIHDIKCRPPRLPKKERQLALIKQESYQRLKLKLWKDIYYDVSKCHSEKLMIRKDLLKGGSK